SGVLAAHPSAPKLQEELARDPTVGPALASSKTWLLSPSVRDHLLPGPLPAELITTALFRWELGDKLTGPAGRTEFVDLAVDNLVRTRDCIRGEPVGIPVVVGFAGLRIRDRVSLPWAAVMPFRGWAGTAEADSLRPATLAAVTERKIRFRVEELQSAPR